jgi:V8-like Glu-specific endopeptidase
MGFHGSINEIWITPPGLSQVYSWQVARGSVTTIKCKVLGTLYSPDGKVSNDLAILDTGSYTTTSYLSLSSTILPDNAIVDVIGYPGDILHEWIKSHEGLRTLKTRQEEAERLFQKGSLTVTRGMTKVVGNTITYNISTCPGMGGSCVLYKGYLIGENRILKCL